MLTRTFGCVRKVYNLALQARDEAWLSRGERATHNASSGMLTAWKRTDEFAYVNEVSCVPLQQALRHLQTAFNNFFTRRAGYPCLKSRKKSRDSAEYTASAFRWRDGRLTLAKMSERLNIVWSRRLPDGSSPSTVTVSRDGEGRWFVSMLCDDRHLRPLPPVGTAVGLDAGVASLLTLSTGEKVADPRYEERDQRRLANAQREPTRKQKGSNNSGKRQAKVARIHARVADSRKDYLHKLSTRLVRENQTVVIEDLAVRNQPAAQRPSVDVRLRCGAR